MSNQFISVPLKGTVDLSLNEPLKKYFTKTLGVRDKAKIDSICGELAKLRVQATAGSIKRNVGGLELISGYADQLAVLVKKIPSENLVIQFTWDDALDKGNLFTGRKEISTHPQLLFEHFCVLFNVASLQSQLCANFTGVETDEELKTIAKWFQTAAGIYEHIAVNIITIAPSQNLTWDLNSGVLSALSSLMLAQAQEIIVKKGIRDGVKDGLVAKLCVQAEEMYAETVEGMSKQAAFIYQWDRNWISNLKAKQLLYSGLAQYFQSQDAHTGKRIGEEISRLDQTIKILKKAQKQKPIDTCSHYLEEATRLLENARKENDFIYHDVIPDVNSLPLVDKVSSARLAKAIPIPDQLSTDFKDLFADVDFSKKDTPLKTVLDASIHAAGFYVNKLLSGTKFGRRDQ